MLRMAACIIVCCSVLSAAGPARAEDAPPAKPKLVVVIVVDQMRADYLERFKDDFGDGGFRRFLNDGAVFTHANFSHGVTKTGSSHAVISSGANPAVNGIASNEWYTPDLKDVVYCVAGKSPQLLKVETLGNAFKDNTDRSGMVISGSLKDRAAILMGGPRADLAFWWDEKNGVFQTSQFYTHMVPYWIRKFGGTRPADQWFDKSWELLLPESAYAKDRADDVEYEKGKAFGIGNAFPHPMRGKSEKPDRRFYDTVTITPYGNDLLIAAVQAMLDAYPLGRDDVPDLLCISFSSNDECGHVFGPYSREVHDITVRLDRQLAGFFAYLDERCGKGRWVAVLTSDHGAGPIPEYAIAQGWGGGRYKKEAILEPAEAAVRRVTGIEDKDAKLAGYMTPWIYLNVPLLKEGGHDVGKVAAAVAEAVSGLEFVERAIPFTAFDSDDSISKMAAQAYVLGRSGQVYVHVKDYWITGRKATTHGTAHEYDTHVPLCFYGTGIKAGVHAEPADPIDIVPTICKLLGFTPPKTATGKVLGDALVRE